MDVSIIRPLIKKMLDSRDLMPETREELAEYLAELDKGELHPDDVAYVYGLARRLGYSQGGAPADPYAAEAMGDSLGEEFPGGEDSDGDSETAAAVRAEIALRSVEQAQALVARLRETGSGGAGADTATLDEIEKALGDAAEALKPRD